MTKDSPPRLTLRPSDKMTLRVYETDSGFDDWLAMTEDVGSPVGSGDTPIEAIENWVQANQSTEPADERGYWSRASDRVILLFLKGTFVLAVLFLILPIAAIAWVIELVYKPIDWLLNGFEGDA
ncbi:hypothetical protein E2L06_04105 [Haloterrigena sp. H1]|uniref:hypothetical protein n=1 Tax=Haloterrigena sp. H1 TaxID=2552943 RepID=UPI00110E405D|nr:hypothetical protein [Haloterrigena sp. H1]TMT85817.1 hypothetical protein E2L06_04105 [Haloterrigena sp. H1]